MSKPESKLTARLFLLAKQARKSGRLGKLTVVWPILGVLLSLVAAKRNTTILILIKEGKKKMTNSGY